MHSAEHRVVRARPAGVADIAELVRLRGVMLAEMYGAAPEPGAWQRLTAETLRRRIGDGTLAAFVVDRPTAPADGAGMTYDPGTVGPADGRSEPSTPSPTLVACAVGTIERRLGDPRNPGGEAGYVLNVVTEHGHRGRGCARACLVALLDWYRRRGVPVVDLRATPMGEPLYRSLGFTPSSMPMLRLDNRSG